MRTPAGAAAAICRRVTTQPSFQCQEAKGVKAYELLSPEIRLLAEGSARRHQEGCPLLPHVVSAMARRTHQRAAVGHDVVKCTALVEWPVTSHPRPLNQRRTLQGILPANGRPAPVVDPREGPQLNANARNDTIKHRLGAASCRSNGRRGPARIDNLDPSIATAREF